MNSPSISPSVCFVIEKIIDVCEGDGNMKNYKVQWTPTWISSSNLVGCQHLIEEFLQQKRECEGKIETSLVNELHNTHMIQTDDQIISTDIVKVEVHTDTQNTYLNHYDESANGEVSNSTYFQSPVIA